MDIRIIIVFVTLLLSQCVKGFRIEWTGSLLRKLAQKNTYSYHGVVKRQIPWYPDCPSCGFNTKAEPSKVTDKTDKTRGSYSIFRTSILNKMRSDLRCKDAPSVSVCNILKRVQGGFRG